MLKLGEMLVGLNDETELKVIENIKYNNTQKIIFDGDINDMVPSTISTEEGEYVYQSYQHFDVEKIESKEDFHLTIYITVPVAEDWRKPGTVELQTEKGLLRMESGEGETIGFYLDDEYIGNMYDMTPYGQYDWEHILMGANPIEDGWEDGGGCSLSYSGWGEEDY